MVLVLKLALPPQRLRPDTRVEHQDTVSHTGHSVQWPPIGFLVSLNFLENACCCSQREQEGSEEMYHFF